MKELSEKICEFLEEGEDLALATICEQSGSTPRSAGARMLIKADGSFFGTIGGGLVEALVQKEAANVFKSCQSIKKAFDLSNKDAAVSDMICGGNLEVIIEYIPACPKNLEAFRLIRDSLIEGRRVMLFSGTSSGNNFHFAVAGAEVRGEVPGSDPAPYMDIKNIPVGIPRVIEKDGTQFMVEAFAPSGCLFLLGAGHVSRCTSQAASKVGFHLTVIDDREEFANRERFEEADRIIVPDNFENCLKDYVIDRDSYLVIVTRGHVHDRDVLKQALETDAGYIGMIGSHKKRDAIYKNLLENGTPQSAIDRVHSPIGIEIGAETPEEIAVSIVAELIAHRAESRKNAS
ncbi:XdhC family aldehyde oxidoreductase maturation factor [Maridesulfovibrio bastinii]|uniref:XdhC family aldehyde oxidoreductase maturation factor n=1 Tax=Maridesulfovibrio bastinii TaxID=47157 RepID=UPI0003F7C3AC|nr:XdhC/CoxI family protein [Maridesulfovibrio bastinii]